jgi:hypothetical protein
LVGTQALSPSASKPVHSQANLVEFMRIAATLE